MQYDTKEKIKNYFRENFDKKTLITKGIIAAAACALVLIFSLSFYYWLKDKTGNPFGHNNFWYIKIVHNTGIGFGGMNGNLPAIFAVQSIVAILLIGMYFFLCKDRWTSAFIALAIFGGFFNLFQRAATPSVGVLDYFQFGFWENFPTFNWPDMFVVIGIFGFVVTYIIYLVKQKDEEDEIKARDEEVDKQPTPAPAA